MRRDFSCTESKIVRPIASFPLARGNAPSLLGFSSYQLISATMRVIAYGITLDYTDEYIRIGEDTTLRFVRIFAKVIIQLFGEEYLRAPNEEDTKRLVA